MSILKCFKNLTISIRIFNTKKIFFFKNIQKYPKCIPIGYIVSFLSIFVHFWTTFFFAIFLSQKKIMVRKSLSKKTKPTLITSKTIFSHYFFCDKKKILEEIFKMDKKKMSKMKYYRIIFFLPQKK